MELVQFLGKNKWQLLAGSQALCLALPHLLEYLKKYHCKPEEEIPEQFPPLQIQHQTSSQYQASVYEQQGAKLARVQQAKFSLFRICITGGQYSGINTTIEHLNEKLPEQGIKVFMVPNIRQIAKESGATFQNLSKSEKASQLAIQIKLQLKLEDYFARLAKLAGKPAVILCHQGVLDYKVEFDDDVWQTALNEQGWNTVLLRDKRYDAILHLVTGANGAKEEFLAEKPQATEDDIKKEIELDEKIQNAWNGHPHEVIIPNRGQGLQSKINEVYTHVQQFVGLPITSKIFKKYLIDSKIQFPNDIDFNQFDVEEVIFNSKLYINNKTFLQIQDNQQYNKIRKRGQNKFFSYSQAIRQQKDVGFHEKKKNINAHEYMMLFQLKDQTLHPVQKKRTCFVWEKQSYIIDEIIRENGNISLLRIETLDQNNEIMIPDFIKVQAEVTGQKQYDTAYFAQKQK